MVSKLKYIIIVGFMAAVNLHVAWSQELWMECGVSYSLMKDFDIKVDFQNRYLNTGKYENYKRATSIAVQYKMRKYFKLGTSYRYTRGGAVYEGVEDELYDDHQRYCFDVHGKLPIQSRYKLKNRSRYQVSLKQEGASKHFYRNKTTFEIKIDKKTKFSIIEELILRLDKGSPLASHFSIGLQYQLIGNLYISPFFRVENVKLNDLSDRNNIMGTGLYYKF